MRIFLDANVLFSAAKSDGAVRALVHALLSAGHILVVDEYVVTEARRNVAVKGGPSAVDVLDALLTLIERGHVRYPTGPVGSVQWLPEKDQPVLLAAMALKCDALVTGDRTHFGPGYGKTVNGVKVYSPAQLAAAVFPFSA